MRVSAGTVTIRTGAGAVAPAPARRAGLRWRAGRGCGAAGALATPAPLVAGAPPAGVDRRGGGGTRRGRGVRVDGHFGLGRLRRSSLPSPSRQAARPSGCSHTTSNSTSVGKAIRPMRARVMCLCPMSRFPIPDSRIRGPSLPTPRFRSAPDSRLPTLPPNDEQSEFGHVFDRVPWSFASESGVLHAAVRHVIDAIRRHIVDQQAAHLESLERRQGGLEPRREQSSLQAKRRVVHGVDAPRPRCATRSTTTTGAKASSAQTSRAERPP